MSQRGPVKTPSSKGVRQPMSEMRVCLMVTSSGKEKAEERQEVFQRGSLFRPGGQGRYCRNRTFTEPAESDGESPVDLWGKNILDGGTSIYEAWAGMRLVC